MRRAAPLIVIAVATIGASVAIASVIRYDGTVKGGGTVHMFVKRGQGTRKISRFDFSHVGLKCNGRHRTVTGNLRSNYKPRVASDGSFRIRARNPSRGLVRVNGKLKDHGRAAGTIRLDGSFVLDGNNQATKHCRSGVKDWRAKR